VIVSANMSAPRSRRELDDRRFALKTWMPPQRNVVGEFRRGDDGRINLESVALPGVEVIDAVPGRCVDQSRSGVERDVIAEDEDAFPREECVSIFQILERRALKSLNAW